MPVILPDDLEKKKTMALDIHAVIRTLRDELTRVNEAIAAIEQLSGQADAFVTSPKHGDERSAAQKSKSAGSSTS